MPHGTVMPVNSVLLAKHEHRTCVTFCTVFYCTVLYGNVLCCTLIYCTVVYCSVLYCFLFVCCLLVCTLKIGHFLQYCVYCFQNTLGITANYEWLASMKKICGMSPQTAKCNFAWVHCNSV